MVLALIALAACAVARADLPTDTVTLTGETTISSSTTYNAKITGSGSFKVTNGATPGYFYTPESLAEGGYEVGNSSFAPECGDIITAKMAELYEEVK